VKEKNESSTFIYMNWAESRLNSINRDFTDENKHDVDRYSLTKADTKIDNKHELLKIRRSYWDDSVLNLQQLDTQKRLKIKAA